MSRKRILLVEDAPQLSRLYRRTLTQVGYEVYLAETIPQAEITLRDQLFDLLLLDIQVEDGTSLHLIRDYSQVVPIIAMSSEERYRHDCDQLGAVTFLAKPLRLRNLSGHIDQALALR